MRRAGYCALGLILALALLPASHAAPPASAQEEIHYLLQFVKTSGCAFYRNGSWYDSAKAEGHLRDKYIMLAARDQIQTAEDFIDKAATQSSLSGRPYAVRCAGVEAVPSRQWLSDALARYRAPSGRDAPRGASPLEKTAPR